MVSIQKETLKCVFSFTLMTNFFFFINISLQVTHADFKKVKDKVMLKKKKGVPEGLHM